MASLREIKRKARMQLHALAAEPALYLAEPTAVPVGVTVRLHLSFNELGELLRGGFADRQEMTPRIIFMGSQVQPLHRGIVVTKDLGAYLVDNDLPPDDITITAEVSKLSRNQTISFGWDPDLQFMGLAAEQPGSNPGFLPTTVIVTKGEPGKSAFELWREQPGNEDKTEDEFIESLGSGSSTSWGEKGW
ncbi:hypothetical protein NAV33_07280 [Pseudomonas stutzeri]|uniref:hypothetical protein n=1 Tax=Stutzerimonas stutzeri TaxID=316 RepID=UPI00210A9CD6|nr:hypothetical protein [Stutzerimonas stutzeri]MCQ4311696.1 hypothetical protein [Stutzerimonas stutzeri]